MQYINRNSLSFFIRLDQQDLNEALQDWLVKKFPEYNEKNYIISFPKLGNSDIIKGEYKLENLKDL